MYTKRILDLDENESSDILNEIFLHQERLYFTCRFKWTENAVAIWDNRSTLHQGLTDFFPGRDWAMKELWTGLLSRVIFLNNLNADYRKIHFKFF